MNLQFFTTSCCWLILQIHNDKKKLKMTKALANGYPSESAQWELSNKYQYDRDLDVFRKSLHPYALDKVVLALEGSTIGLPLHT